ncbi:TIGR01244 family sulfur transferase [Phaeovulum sp.]|uniref:TIGR01244 family sulfur transferase n=1 Tax=Phaeovulum sp. TaxID=2934796 RepID=UPI0039E4242A
MDVRQITPEFAVGPQIAPEDIPALAEMGFKTILNNRPDQEVDGVLDSAAMQAAAERAGLTYRYLPYHPGRMTPDLVTSFETAMAELSGPVFAYCRSGTRCSHLWAMWQAGKMPLDQIIRASANVGYDHRDLLPLLEAHAADRV